ncbi:hypothetical protein D3C71_587390 [compost metagenome]
MPAGDDVQCRDDRHAGLHHRGHLPAEEGDVSRLDRTAGGTEQWLWLRFHRAGVDALAAQFGPQQVGILGQLLALHLHAPLVGPLPDKRLQLHGGARHRFLLDRTATDRHVGSPARHPQTGIQLPMVAGSLPSGQLPGGPECNFVPAADQR